MKRRLITTAILILAITGLVGCGSDNKEAPQRQTAEVQRGDLIISITADGTLDMPHEAKLRFGTPGTVKQIPVSEGDHVKEGALLAKLDDTTQKIAIALAQYDVELAMSQLFASIHPQVMGVLEYPDATTALSFLIQAQEEINKAISLVGNDNEQAAIELSQALHDLDLAQEILSENEFVFRHGLDLVTLRRSNIELQKAELALQNAKEQLMQTEIMAPFDGTVVDIGIKEKDQLSSFDYSSVTAIHLVDTGTIEMNGVVDEIDIFQVKVGQEVIIIVDAMPDLELNGKVTFISPFGTEETGVVEFAVTIQLEPTDIELRGGLTATADIIIEKHENVLLIPSHAIVETPAGSFVGVVTDETTEEPERRKVITGAQDMQLTEIVSGLEEGEQVVIINDRR